MWMTLQEAQNIPDLVGSYVAVDECYCCTGTASGCVPRRHSQPSYGDSLWPDSCKLPPEPQQVELQEVLECVPWTLGLCSDKEQNPNDKSMTKYPKSALGKLIKIYPAYKYEHLGLQFFQGKQMSLQRQSSILLTWDTAWHSPVVVWTVLQTHHEPTTRKSTGRVSNHTRQYINKKLQWLFQLEPNEPVLS